MSAWPHPREAVCPKESHVPFLHLRRCRGRPRRRRAAHQLASLRQPASPPAQVEQVDRATGLNGSQPLLQSAWADGESAAVTDDGRFAVFSGGGGDESLASDILPLGLYVRDTVLGTTRRIATGQTAWYSSMDRTGSLIAFYSTSRLHPADTNDDVDLYAWSRVTGDTALLSRATGRHGAATGTIETAGITATGSTAVWSTQSGVFRRNLVSGKTTRISDGTFATFPTRGPAGHADDHVSDDGRVVSTSEGVLTPWGTWSTGIVPDPTYATDNWRSALISPSGRIAVVQDETRFWTINNLSRIDTKTGVKTAVPAAPALEGRVGRVTRVLSDDRRVIANTWSEDASGESYPVTIDLVTGAVTRVDAPIGNYSRNMQFAIWSNPWQSDRFTPTGLFVSPIGDHQLPGTVETPSPMAWVGLDLACKPSPDAPADYVLPRITVGLETGPLPATSARIRAWNAAGESVVDQTVTTTTADPVVGIPVGENPFRIEVTVALADGRVTTDAQDIAARTPNCTDYIPE